MAMRSVLLTVGAVVAGCSSSPTLDTSCTSANHCIPGEVAGCEPGYVWLDPLEPEDFRCVPELATLACGPGTTEVSGRCEPESRLTCGSGTEERDGQCVVADALDCGPGTYEMDGECLPESSLECGGGTVEVSGWCQADLDSLCATGTEASQGRCIPDLAVVCNSGTHPAFGSCAADVVCGSDTVEEYGVCRSALGCGAGTLERDLLCAPDLESICAGGTVPHGGQCVLPLENLEVGTLLDDANRTVAGHEDRGLAYCIEYDWLSECIAAHQDYLYRFVVTDFAQSQADAWVAEEIAPVGQGYALHVQTSSYDPLVDDGPEFREVAGGCAGYSPYSEGSFSRAEVGFVRWNGGTWEHVACAESGSVGFESTASGVRLTLNIGLDDGTTITGEVIETPQL